MLLTSHDLVDVDRLADRVVVIAAGRVLASGAPTDLRRGDETLEDAYLRLVRGDREGGA
jgi:ABC-2 type transport system ATP-binding protein